MSSSPFEPLYGKRKLAPKAAEPPVETKKEDPLPESLSPLIQAELQKFLSLQNNHQNQVKQDGLAGLSLFENKQIVLIAIVLLIILGLVAFVIYKQKKQKTSINKLSEQLVKLNKMRKKNE